MPDVEKVTLTEAEKVTLLGVTRDADALMVCEQIIADRLAAVRAEADTHRESAEAGYVMWQAERERADRLEGMCDRLAEKIVDLEDALRASSTPEEPRDA